MKCLFRLVFRPSGKLYGIGFWWFFLTGFACTDITRKRTTVATIPANRINRTGIRYFAFAVDADNHDKMLT